MNNFCGLKWFLIFLPFMANSQEIHQFEAVEFSPPEQSMIKSFTGSQAMAIQANNTKGVAVSIPSSNQSHQLLWFSEMNQINDQWMIILKDVAKSNQLELHLFFNDVKDQISENDQFSEFSIVPNSKMLSEAVFGSELKHNRAFLVDPSGIITKVFVAKELKAQSDPIQYMNTFITP